MLLLRVLLALCGGSFFADGPRSIHALTCAAAAGSKPRRNGEYGMTYTLYSHDGSGGFAVEAALVKAGASHKLVSVDTGKGEQNKPEFVAINPMRQVPALTLPDGTVMTESAAIVVHLAHAFPDKGLAPKPATPAHARFLRWMFFMAANLYEGD